MNITSGKLKLIIAAVYLSLLFIGLYFLFSAIDLKDLTSYNFIKSNRDIILEYKEANFLFLTIAFFIFCIIWVLFLGFASPLLLFGGFVFGKWWGVSIVLISTSIGATLLYILAATFFKDFIEEKLASKFSKLREFFNKNDIIYFMCFRFVGGGGTPFGIQNVLPILFNMPIKNYFIATVVGCLPSMFITVAIGSGIERVIDENSELTFMKVASSPDIYLPIAGFFIIVVSAFILNKIFFEKKLK
tara:strand:- start:116 stop:850 length:735 start_codon:yes stop_codon:yes gene_type:complete